VGAAAVVTGAGAFAFGFWSQPKRQIAIPIVNIARMSSPACAIRPILDQVPVLRRNILKAWLIWARLRAVEIC
jgi:hypothetical protein